MVSPPDELWMNLTRTVLAKHPSEHTRRGPVYRGHNGPHEAVRATRNRGGRVPPGETSRTHTMGVLGAWSCSTSSARCRLPTRP